VRRTRRWWCSELRYTSWNQCSNPPSHTYSRLGSGSMMCHTTRRIKTRRLLLADELLPGRRRDWRRADAARAQARRGRRTRRCGASSCRWGRGSHTPRYARSRGSSPTCMSPSFSSSSSSLHTCMCSAAAPPPPLLHLAWHADLAARCWPRLRYCIGPATRLEFIVLNLVDGRVRMEQFDVNQPKF
jgi:hypothetical protein